MRSGRAHSQPVLRKEVMEMDRARQIIHVGFVGIAVNAILALAKIIIGQIVNSAAIVSDGLNNFTDGLSSVVTIIGTKLAGRRPDREHPFGHGRIEYITTGAVGLIIIVTGALSLVDSIEKIITPEDTRYDTASLLIVAGAILVKIFLGRYTQKRGTGLKAEALVGAGKDALFDAAASSTILVGMAVSYLFHISIDAWLGAFIALLIIKAGVDVLRDALDDIQGRRIPEETADRLKTAIGAFPDVEGVYDLILDRYGPDQVLGSVHIQVPDQMTARQIDALSRDISALLYTQYGIIMTVGIYANNTDDPTAQQIRRQVEAILAHEPYILQMHGFYVNEVRRQISLDIVVDFDAGDKKESIRSSVQRAVQKENPGYTVSINLDTDFGGVGSAGDTD